MRPLLRFVLPLLVTACGPKDPQPDTASGSSSSSGGTDAPTTGTTDTPTGTGEPGCVDPSIDTVGPAIKVLLRNTGDAPIWVDAKIFCDNRDPFDLLDPQGEPVHAQTGMCEFTCAEALSGGCGCANGCGDADRVVQIDPGATFEASWSGVHWQTTPLAESCAPGCEPTCVARTQAPAGTYTLIARSSGAVTECEPCGCTPNADGWCEMGGIRSGDELAVETKFDYPTTTEVLIEFP